MTSIVEKYDHIRYALFPDGERTQNCWSFVRLFLKDRGIIVDDFDLIGRMPKELEQSFLDALKITTCEEHNKPKKNDIVLMQSMSETLARYHCGVIIDAENVAHIGDGSDRVIVSPLFQLRKKWELRFWQKSIS